MLPISKETVEQAIHILGSDGIDDSVIEARVFALVSDALTARRLIDWIPEVFGIVLVSHIGKVVLPTTFSAKSASGTWHSLKFDAEPIFAIALEMATHIYHNGPRAQFQNITMRSAMTNTVNKALNSGAAIDGATLSGPALIGIPAEVYSVQLKPFWRRLFS